MIHPINNHILIKPIQHDEFIKTEKETYEEIGEVIDFDGSDTHGTSVESSMGRIKKGCLVYFDAWLAAKYPGENKGEFYWLVKYEDVRAVSYDALS